MTFNAEKALLWIIQSILSFFFYFNVGILEMFIIRNTAYGIWGTIFAILFIYSIMIYIIVV